MEPIHIRRTLSLVAVAIVSNVCTPVVVDAKVAKGSAKGSGKAPADVWQVEYDRGQTAAAASVYITKDKVKLDTHGLYEITASGPAWSAVVVNKKTKKMVELPAAVWQKQGFFIDPPASDYMNPKNKASEETLNFRGLPAKRRTWKTMESDGFYRYRSEPQKCTIELITMDGGIPIDKMQLALISVWYGIPHPSGIPLIWQNIMKKETTQRLRVLNVAKIPAGSVSFQPTKGCKRELSMMTLVDNKYSSAMTDFIEFENTLPSQKKK